MARTRRRKPDVAVSGPSALSERTDLTPAGSSSQPLRVASGQAYGARAAQLEQQRAAPLPVSSSPGSGAGGGPTVAPPQADYGDQLFAPTERPSQPPTAGATRYLPDDPDLLLREIYRVYPHPEIGRLLAYGAS